MPTLVSRVAFRDYLSGFDKLPQTGGAVILSLGVAGRRSKPLPSDSHYELNMPDKRKHRGPHPQDEIRFGQSQLEQLRDACRDLNWLLSRGYASPSSTKIVGDRYDLDARQRVAVGRCCCPDDLLAIRREHQLREGQIVGQEVWIDGFNVVTTVEAALSGGAILIARDGCCRDMASMHGTYKKVTETATALDLIGQTLSEMAPESCRWLLDQPVSNSGRLKSMLAELGRTEGWQWEFELVPDPDPVLKTCGKIVVTADSAILDRADKWFNLGRVVIEKHVPDAWMIDLSDVDPEALG